jgi:multiple sugar transport system ATP-binding protein
MASLTLDRMRKEYPNGHVAVAGASVEVADGELLVLVGPSGCGKSTLLRMIAGLEEITAGTLAIGGRVVNDLAPKDRDIAMVFQSYALYPHMTVAQNLGFGLTLRGMAKAEVAARVREAAGLLELDALLERRPAALSGGQRQRVALGRALVRQPQVFLLDEPLSNLDAKLRGAMRVEIARLHRRLGATMVYVTHDQIEAMTLGQRIVVMRDGHVQQVDTPMALYDRPANLFVATFLGSPGMNVLRGRPARGDGGPVFGLDGGATIPLAVDVPEAWLGRDLVLGVRPEALRPAAAGERDFEAPVEVVEPVGNEAFVNLRVGDQALVLRGPPRGLPAPGAAWRLAAPGPDVHWFEPATGSRLER